MLKYSQQTAIDICCSRYDKDMSFKQICKELEDETWEGVNCWDGVECMRGADISTLIHEVEEAISHAMKMGA